MAEQQAPAPQGFLPGVRVIEVADELGEYCGKVLAGLGADVIKVEPPGGEQTRSYGPFYQDTPDPEQSLFFWHYNFGKRGITLDLDAQDGQEQFRRLAARADVVLDTRPRGYLEQRGLGYEALKAVNPTIIVARISPFGDTGPYADYRGSDLVHLAMGGMMMCTGYDPDPSGFYETPPIAPQMWHAYHVTGEIMAFSILQALCHRNTSGVGQMLSVAVHEAMSKNTEIDFPSWVYNRTPVYRQTARHAMPSTGPARDALTPWSIGPTKDGRYVMSLVGYRDEFGKIVELLDRYGMAEDLKEERYTDEEYRSRPATVNHLNDVVKRFLRRFLFESKWQEGQALGFTWVPLRLPHENLAEEHWKHRETFIEVEHPELGRSFTEIGAKWLAPQVPWRKGPRAPHRGEHNAEVLSTLPTVAGAQVTVTPRSAPAPRMSPHGKPFALTGVRFIDVTWMLASGGAGRFLGALGAEVIKVEWKTQLRNQLRIGAIAVPPPGGRAERDAATAPLPSVARTSPNWSGFFNDINPGKWGISLNIVHPKGKELFARLLKIGDVVGEGMTPGVIERWGFPYEVMREINPGIILVRQSGLGAIGSYGPMRTNGPTAQSISGLAEMSGLPRPYPPTSIGYSYLDWFGAYNFTTAIMAALYRKQATGQGVYIDSSQAETGTYLTGTAILDWSANGREFQRYGNRSPYKPAAPHGAYRCAGEDRWCAIACFNEDDWRSFLTVIGNQAWGSDPRFATLESRLKHQDALDKLVTEATQTWDRYQLMHALQGAGVPAGVCQTAQDRFESDPQLEHLRWVTELLQTEMGTWPVKAHPVKFSETPAHMGGITGRASPCYGEDNEYVYGELLGLSTREIKELQEQDVI